MLDVALAIDPGRSKCGLMLVRRDGEKLASLWRGVVETEGVCEAIEGCQAVAAFQMIIVGSGTSSQTLVATIRERFPSVGILVVDERDTTLQARERYWEFHKRRGWRRLLPATLQMPPEPFDDFAALILAERVLLT